jgi:sulfofructose kinase
MAPVDVVCLGLATADTIVTLRGWPEPDGRAVAEGIERAGGGPAATAALAIARMGRSVVIGAAVGDDDAGTFVRQDLERSGVDTDHVTVIPGRTAQSVILVDRSAATRTILHLPGVAPVALGPALRRAAEAAGWVHVDHAGYPLAMDLDRGRLSVDAGNPVPGLRLDDLGLYAPSLASLGVRYPGLPPGAAIHRALADGAHRVVVTMGAEGAIAADAGGAWRVAGAGVEVASTLGAGDVFHGALLASMAAGHSLPNALRRANLAAALSCRALDGRSGIASLPELEAALPAAPHPEPILLNAAQ